MLLPAAFRACAVLALLAIGSWRLAQAVEADARNSALFTITTAEVKNHVDTLADDTFEGREAGSRGGRAAGIYLVERLKKAGLRGGASGGSYYQQFNGYTNILAFLEGSDPLLKQQVIVIGAHYDHVGYGTNRNSYGPVGMIHNGADDNASGVAGLLEVVDAIAQLPTPPKRSILFAFWDGEEKGLLGSQHWAENPTVPLADVRLAINIDMIGRLRNSRAMVYGTRTCANLRRLVSRANDVPRLTLDFNWELKPDSDHHTFYSRDIPVLMLHTGLHDDYHRPSDDAHKINHEGLKLVAQLLFGVLIDLADAPVLDGFRSQARYESRYLQEQSEQPLPPPPGRLGIRWDTRAGEEGRIVVTEVAPGSAAATAGIMTGDRLLRFNGQELTDAEQLRTLVLAAENPVTVAVARPGEETPRELQLQLAGKPTRVGISWRTDDAEPGCVILNRVIPGSPADRAGVRPNDRVHRVNGREFAGSEQFRELVTGEALPLLLEIENSGRFRIVEIPPAEATDDNLKQPELRDSNSDSH